MFYTRQVFQNKLIAPTKNPTKNCWSVEKFCCFKNGLTQIKQNSFYIYFFTEIN